MSMGVAATLEAECRASNTSRKSYAKTLGLSETALNALTRGTGGRPAAKTVAAICRAFGPERCREWFPHVQRLAILVAIVDRTPSLADFARLAGLSRRTVEALVFAGSPPDRRQALAIAGALGVPLETILAGQAAPGSSPQMPLSGEATPGTRPPRSAPPSRRHVTTAEVVRLLLLVHLDIRCGRLVPPWPASPDHAPFSQVLAEFHKCTMHGEGTPSRKGRRAAGRGGCAGATAGRKGPQESQGTARGHGGLSRLSDAAFREAVAVLNLPEDGCLQTEPLP